jgi:hypothetical protein
MSNCVPDDLIMEASLHSHVISYWEYSPYQEYYINMPSTNQSDNNNGHASTRQRSAVQPGRGAAPTVSASGSAAAASGQQQQHAVTPVRLS